MRALRGVDWRRLFARTGLAAIAFVAAFALARWWDFVVPAVAQPAYQAVFLANGQVYFGHYNERLGPYVRLDDLFYIQQTPAQEQGGEPTVRLLRRGTELHGPEPRVLVPKSSVLFVEDLSAASEVARFIREQQP